LAGFKALNVHFHLLAEPDLPTLKLKSKYRGLFDLAVMSINSANKINEDFSELFVDGAPVHVESSDFLICLKPEQK